ncbi:hypothetical protein J5U23_02020 [Saccharolobus shibatae B12]|uniref:Uncharacterized protein n=1 Tax=Saccharolobus shibatae (strain ATCC 51178 / DSM 5389 / JCM 8931 / NBRC 15437 / B12) TaxID=523848 RepID=A0A8F5BPN9_SACSH|nr:hypothetical protein J5U23_02020 [Saccharolobus shibatae B12]
MLKMSELIEATRYILLLINVYPLAFTKKKTISIIEGG